MPSGEGCDRREYNSSGRPRLGVAMIPALLCFAMIVSASAGILFFIGPWRALKRFYCWRAAMNMAMADWCGLMEDARRERRRLFKRYHRAALDEVFEE